MTLVQIANLISSRRYSFDDEATLQKQIASVLIEANVVATREVRINPHDRLDFLTEDAIAIEVKIHGTRPQVLTQLHRYAQSERVNSIILVTRKARHLGMPPTLNGKEVVVAHLFGGSF